MSVSHPPGTHSRYVIGCCLIPLGIYGLKNNSRRITYGIGCVWRMPSLSPLSSLGLHGTFQILLHIAELFAIQKFAWFFESRVNAVNERRIRALFFRSNVCPDWYKRG